MADLKLAYGDKIADPNVIAMDMPDTRKWWQKLLRRKNKGILYKGQAVYISNELKRGRCIPVPVESKSTVIGVAVEDSYRDENGRLIGTVMIGGKGTFESKDG